MKIKILLFILLFISQLTYAQQIATVDKVEIESEILDQKRQILIYTPQLYDENILAYYDVIYVYDAQNRELFDLVHSSIKFINTNKHYIVVGITSPYYEETDYARNNDYLPEPLHTPKDKFYGGYCCNSENFRKYITSEVMPYIESNYRTTKHRICVGHSLSASFSIDFMLKNDLFDAYIAISPNFAYDQEQLATAFINFDFNKIKDSKFLFITNANEDWKGWKVAREKVYSYISEEKNIPDNISVSLKSYPNEDHWNVFLPALTDGFKDYFKYLESRKITFSEETYTVKIKVKVPDSSNRVFITGNQASLGNWNPEIIEMNKISDNEREIELTLQNPTEFLFTRGNWDSKAIVNYTYENENITIDPSSKKVFEFEITEWFDDEDK